MINFRASLLDDFFLNIKFPDAKLPAFEFGSCKSWKSSEDFLRLSKNLNYHFKGFDNNNKQLKKEI